MKRTIVSLTVLAAFTFASAAQGNHGGGGGGCGGHGGGGHGGGGHCGHHDGGGRDHDPGDFDRSMGAGGCFFSPLMGVPAWNPGLGQIQLAQAAVAWEQARWLCIQNTVLIDDLAQMRKDARERKHSARRDVECRKRIDRQRLRQAAQKAIREQNRNELRSTAGGVIDWPELLCGDDCKSPRNELEALFAKRTAAPFADLDRDGTRQVDRSCAALRAQLAKHTRDANSNDWVVARRFVDRVAAEAHHTPAAERLAGN